MPDTPPRFCGWCRHGPRACWKLLATADTEDECRELLHARTAGMKRVDTYVCPEGRDPNRRE